MDIRPGKPVENAFAESFNGGLRYECLNTNWFMSVRHAGVIFKDWRLDYNEVRPYSSFNGRSPRQYADAAVELCWPTLLTSGEGQLLLNIIDENGSDVIEAVKAAVESGSANG
tara:strand:- start:187 stop:525 length:339 start_codon:yes stop_codon:yes gene_type:complete